MTDSPVDHAIPLAAELVSAYVSRNSVPAGELPGLIRSVNDAIAALSQTTDAVPEVQPLVPAVPIKKSVHDDHVVCLEDGKRFRSMKRHLLTVHGMSPRNTAQSGDFRAVIPWFPAYAKERSSWL